MNRTIFTRRLKIFLNIRYPVTNWLDKRTLLSQAYRCEEAWAKRLDSPSLKIIKLDQYFIETDKKFALKTLASGVDIDLFANNVQEVSQLDELEHLLYRFRLTKRSNEMMDSTIYAVVRVYLKLKEYEPLMRILNDVENYGIFPDFFTYNVLLDTFIEEKMFREAAQIAVLMMYQEDFSNEISSLLAVHACHLFLKNHALDELYPRTQTENKEEEDDEEEKLERVPFFRNPWFDDHFDLTAPRHLIGKTFFLAGLEIKDELLSKTFQLLGLGMYEKWTKASELLNTLSQSEVPVLISEGVDEFKKYMDSIPNEETRAQLEDTLKKMQDKNLIKSEDLESLLKLSISGLSDVEKRDIKLQQDLFKDWEIERQFRLRKQNLEFEKQRKSEEIAKKKEYLFWKEKELFFFENEDRVLEEFKAAEEIADQVRATKAEDDTYVVPEIVRKMPQKLTRYQRLIRDKRILNR